MDTDRDEMKKRLDNIWNEVQTNLPEINFDNSNNDSDYEIIDHDVEHGFDRAALDDWSDSEAHFERLVNKNHDYEDVNTSMMDIRSIQDIYVDDDDDNESPPFNNNEMSQFKNLTAKMNENKLERASSAQKITKDIFESTNSKLNMDIFNKINFDEMIANVEHNDRYKTQSSANCYLRGVGTSSNNQHLKDEAVLKKLTEMSSGLMNRERDQFSIDNFKTGGVLTTSRSNAYTNKNHDLSYERSSSSSASGSIINNSSISLIEHQLGLNNEESKFLKSHSIKDGNMVATRKLDLRQAQTARPKPTQQRQLNPVEAFLSMKVNKKPTSKIRFLNDRDTESSESESSDDEGTKLMGIELYRQQKRMAQRLQAEQAK